MMTSSLNGIEETTTANEKKTQQGSSNIIWKWSKVVAANWAKYLFILLNSSFIFSFHCNDDDDDDDDKMSDWIYLCACTKK